MRLVIENVSKGDILNNITFSIEEGDRIALIGPNGAGKTTLLNMIMQLSCPTGGKIHFDDVNLSAVFQNNVLDNQLSIYQNLNCRIRDRKSLNNVLAKLNKLGINIKYQYSKLSGGQKRIVNYLRAIALCPNCIILDELSAGIDVDIRQTIWRDLTGYLDMTKCGIIFTTHLLDEVENANKVLFLDNGSVKYFGSVDDFMQRMPKYKLKIDGSNIPVYFDESAQALEYLQSNNLVSRNFEILRTTYTDLFKNMETGTKDAH